jgi:hypothetical protein
VSRRGILADVGEPVSSSWLASPAYIISYHGVFDFPIPPDELWEVMEQPDRFESWWSWLSEFRLEGGGLRAGSVLCGVVSPPLPYRMRLRVDLERCDRPSRIDAAVHGDLEGPARLLLVSESGGSRVSASWTLEMTQRRMRSAARVAYPVLRWGHDRLVDATVRSFRRHLARST